MSRATTYKDAGVDTVEGQRAVDLMKAHVRKTFDENVLTGLGSFGGLYELNTDAGEPVLVSGTDGVGTKLKLAFLMDRHDTVGIDCVAMCVNDVLCQGARPLFFLDYIATGRVRAEKVADIVKGIAEGCRQAGCALIGGETAEMPGFYQDGEYDMAGFSVGIADKKNLITGADVAEGDVIIGLPSSGIHSNGYSLVRKILLEEKGFRPDQYMENLGETLGEALLRPTRIYASACNAVMPEYRPHGIVHVTGGGFFENVPRVLPDGLAAEFDTGSWKVPPVFGFIEKNGAIERKEMFATFNMGIGMMMFAAAKDAPGITEALRDAGEEPEIIGRVSAEGPDGKVVIK